MEPSLAATLAGLGVETQILPAPEVEAPGLAALIQRAPPGTSAADQTEFALALADVVLVGSSSEQNLAICTAAEKLGKRMIAPGDPLPTLGIYTVARRLDPDLPGWPRLTRARSVFGRLEQAILELLAYNWLGREKGGVEESRKRMRKAALGRGWGPSSVLCTRQLARIGA